MSRTHLAFAAIVASCLACVLPGCEQSSNKGSPTGSAASATATLPGGARPKFDRSVLAALLPLPASADTPLPASADRVTLGKMLYFEDRLSKNHDVSCNSCHKLDAFGVDNEATSEGHKKQRGGRNAPTVFNSALHFRQFWDGRASDVEEQAAGPIQNPIEMASNEKRVIETLTSMPEYVDAFNKAFPEDHGAITLRNVGIAIGAFERKLLTPAKLDRFLAGDDAALNEDEKVGAAVFAQAGCPSCHMGSTVGGGLYQRVGLVKPWPSQKDQGRFDVTKHEEDRMLFKVPSLRNVEKTAPYFHDGSVESLEEAVRMMARHQLGKELKDDEVTSIVTFLKTLTATPPVELIAPPTLPKSTSTTPKANPS